MFCECNTSSFVPIPKPSHEVTGPLHHGGGHHQRGHSNPVHFHSSASRIHGGESRKFSDTACNPDSSRRIFCSPSSSHSAIKRCLTVPRPGICKILFLRPFINDVTVSFYPYFSNLKPAEIQQVCYLSLPFWHLFRDRVIRLKPDSKININHLTKYFLTYDQTIWPKYIR